MNVSEYRLGLYLFIAVCIFGLDMAAQNPFIENKGQFPKQVKAKIKLPSGSLFIEEGKLRYVFYSGEQLSAIHDLTAFSKKIKAYSYVVDFVSCNKNILTELIDKSKYHENYFLGASSKWAENVRSYKEVCQKNIYEGIDVKYYIEEEKLKYDIILQANASPKQIKIKYKGVTPQLKKGNIYISTAVNQVQEKQPYAYQKINGEVVEVACVYELKKGQLSFKFPNGYNKNYKLVIDPVLEFSSYSGSTSDNFGYTATYDNFGFLYSGTTSFGTGYPTTIGAYQINYANSSGGTDIAITKYDTTGTQRIYSTYLGGALDELPHSMIVNSANELFIYGTTASADFPTTNSAFQLNFNGGPAFSPSGMGASFPNGSDIFVSKLSADGGSLLASTFIGGTHNDGLSIAPQLKYNYADEVRGEIDIDRQNNIYIATCTQSTDFPTTNTFQVNSEGGQEGCIIKMDNQLSTVVWSSYLGGEGDDAIYSLALDNNDDIYVTGGTTSLNFPTTSGAHQESSPDSVYTDGFITKISSNGAQIISSSYFGTNKYDQSYFVEIGSSNLVYLFGQTEVSGNQMVSNASYSTSGGGQFIAVFEEDLTSVLRSTAIGTGKGTPDISPTAFLVDVCDKIYIAGWGSNLGGSLSTLNLPVSDSAYQQNTDGNDIYLMVLDDELSTMIYATYFGGSQSNEHVDGGTSRFDKKGIIYQSVCAGCGGNSDFPIEPNPGAVSVTNNSANCNNGVFKFNFDFPMVIADFNAPFVSCDTLVAFQNLTSSNTAVTYFWDFGDGNTSNQINPVHSFDQSGSYSIMLTATDNSTCNVSDSIVKEIYILSNSSDTIDTVLKCPNQQIQIGILPVSDPTVIYFWAPSFDLSSVNVPNPFCNTNSNQQYQLLISNGECTDTIFQEIMVKELSLDAGSDTSYCSTPILLTAVFSGEITSIHWSSEVDFSDTLSSSNELLALGPGIFFVKISDGYCELIDSVKVLSENINIDVFGNDICIGDSTVIGVTNLNPEIPIVSYNWNTNNLDTSTFVDFPLSPLWYIVEVINNDGCITKDSVFISTYEYPIIDSIWASDTVVFKGEEVTLNVLTNDNVSWEDFLSVNSQQNLIANITKCYQFNVFNVFGCLIGDSICINVKDVFCNENRIKIPTAFSPNDDNINDTYFIEDAESIVTSFKLEIFNRLGQKVFSSRNILDSWDGKFMGKKLNPQVFDFYLELECIGNKRLFHKGNITLVR